MSYIKRPRRVPRNHPVKAFDVETRGNERDFVCGTFQDANGQRFTTSADELRGWLLSPDNAGSIIYATNLFYDYSVLFGFSPSGHQALFTKSKLLRVHVPVKGKRIIRFYDTSNLTNCMSVAELGKMVGLEKLPTPVQLVAVGDEWQGWCCLEHRVEGCIECYNRRDCDITYKWALLFQRVCKEQGCEVKTTIAATAMDLWKRVFAAKDLFVPPEWVNTYLREAYHGGFTFTFRKGETEGVPMNDINSLYPSVLRDYDYPDMSTMVIENRRPSLKNIMKYEGFSRVLVEYPECYFPILPVAIGGYLLTCTGVYEGLWTHVELREAIKRGCKILKVYSNLYFTKTVRACARYTEDIYLLRKQCKERGDSFEGIYKLFMNALSGKFGQKTDNELYEIVDISKVTSVDEIAGCQTFPVGKREYYIKGKPSTYTPDYINVAWAAYMTAYARLRLIYFLEQAFPNVYACDTDSVISCYEYPYSKEMGKMDLKGYMAKVVFQYPKQYAAWDELDSWVGHIKGVPRRLQPKFYDEGEVSWLKPATAKEALRLGVEPATWIEVARCDRPKLDKRLFLSETVGPDGTMDSRPYTYEEACEVFRVAPHRSKLEYKVERT